METNVAATIETWNPSVGAETLSLLQHLDLSVEAQQKLLNETIKIMQICGNPNNECNNNIGLVIGYIQSGKTMSFTTLTSLAKDNNYQVVIIIAGTSTPLVRQSTDRLMKDLRLNERYDRKWTLLKNPHTSNDKAIIKVTLAQWKDPTFRNEKCRTLLITVMKNSRHLQNLVRLFQGLDLVKVPVLIIDDEGDQASLNTKARLSITSEENLTEKEVSAIYSRIMDLMNIFSHHTFLQYTATPQAPLFINIIDRISPNFIKFLTPGTNYTGGIEFFLQNPKLIETIPLDEIPTNEHPVNEPSPSLLFALKLFFLGVAAGEFLNDQKNRSMLVHPSRLTDEQNTYYHWIQNVKASWIRLLKLENNDSDKQALLDEFNFAYQNLLSTVPDLPSFEDLIGINLIHSIEYTQVMEINASRGRTPSVPWRDIYAFILVGGQAMDRGFTVEGLTVTYMPRNIGVGNVDTIQQRARFFGYKRTYLGYCRVFLDSVTINAYQQIVEHEEDIRKRLNEFNLLNKHLNKWDRELVLSQLLNLCRGNVLSVELERESFTNTWFIIRSPHDTTQLIEDNRNVVQNFLQTRINNFAANEGHPDRTTPQIHLVAKLSLQECFDELLYKLKFTRESDSSGYTSLRYIIKNYLERNKTSECIVYLMSVTDINIWEPRVRRLNENGEIQQLFQGRYPTSGNEVIYPGDREIKDENLLTIQIHMLDILNTSFLKVPTIAVWIPECVGRDIIRQRIENA